VPNSDGYRRQAEECIALGNEATSIEERARQYARAGHCARLAMDELAKGSRSVRRSAGPALIRSRPLFRGYFSGTSCSPCLSSLTRASYSSAIFKKILSDSRLLALLAAHASGLGAKVASTVPGKHGLGRVKARAASWTGCSMVIWILRKQRAFVWFVPCAVDFFVPRRCN